MVRQLHEIVVMDGPNMWKQVALRSKRNGMVKH